MNETDFDGLLLFTYGGPESLSEVRPFVTSILGPHADARRIDISVRRYEFLGGASPINQHSRALLVRLINRFKESSVDLPIYWASLHGQPSAEAVFNQIAAAGGENLAVFVPAPFPLDYMQKKYVQTANDAIAAAANTAKRQGRSYTPPKLTWLPAFYDHPCFIKAQALSIERGRQQLEKQLGTTLDFDDIIIVFSVHSLPLRWAEAAEYQSRYTVLCGQIAQQLGAENWLRAFQSQTGPDTIEWLGPEVGEVLWSFRNNPKKKPVLLVPLGFPLDNMEVACDLDYQMGILCRELDLPMFRTSTVAVEEPFVQMVEEMLYPA